MNLWLGRRHRAPSPWGGGRGGDAVRKDEGLALRLSVRAEEDRGRRLLGTAAEIRYLKHTMKYFYKIQQCHNRMGSKHAVLIIKLRERHILDVFSKHMSVGKTVQGRCGLRRRAAGPSLHFKGAGSGF